MKLKKKCALIYKENESFSYWMNLELDKAMAIILLKEVEQDRIIVTSQISLSWGGMEPLEF